MTKTAKPTHHGAWTGAAVGALVGIIFPPAVGESRIEEQLEKALTHANKLVEKQVAADADELEREIDEAARKNGNQGLQESARLWRIPSRAFHLP